MKANPNAPALQSLSLGALLDTDLPERAWLLEPWLRQQESALVWAAPGVGKTMLTLSLALTLAGGGSLMGWTAPQPRRVLVIDGEMPLDDLKGRLKVLAGAIADLDLEAARANLTILARHHQHPDTTFPDFGDPDRQDEALGVIRRHRPDLVILDNLSTLATLDDENGAAEAQRFVRLLTRLKQAGIGVIVVHHSGKSGSAFRGSSMLATTFEVILGLTRESGDDLLDTSGLARFTLRWDKYRGKRDPSIGNREVALRETFEGLRWTAERPRDEVLQALASLVQSGRFSTRAAAGEALPEHLWPTPGKPPSTGWVSNKFALMDAQGVMRSREVDAFLKAAREGDASDPHDDL
jgi:hypothetical protein